MEKRKKYIEEAAERETVRLFNNSLLHPEFKYGFILGMTHADKVPFVKNHKEYDTINKDVIDRACEWLNKILYIHTEKEEDKDWGKTNSVDWVTSDYDTVEELITAFKQAMEE